jgi:hypothetical protein
LLTWTSTTTKYWRCIHNLAQRIVIDGVVGRDEKQSRTPALSKASSSVS